MKKPNYVNKKIRSISKQELAELIKKVEEQNKKIEAYSKFNAIDLFKKCGQ